VVRVLVVEDERKLAQVLSSALQAEHYDVVVAATGEDGFYRANAERFDLVVLDLMLPGRSGLITWSSRSRWPSCSHASVPFCGAADRRTCFD
jgi:DNA-binding response OmpR family regulator